MRSIIVITLLAATFATPASAGSPTGWSGMVLPRGAYRQQIKSKPINQRPGRFLHIYGNSVRLAHQNTSLRGSRPVRQIIIGTPRLRDELRSRR